MCDRERSEDAEGHRKGGVCSNISISSKFHGDFVVDHEAPFRESGESRRDRSSDATWSLIQSMQLKSIRLVGFKSFADETVIETGKGITAVVGPNGCGKSNIVDAVRWVLGEKSGRALRGKSMEDVIFMGAESRKPSGMAEVEIVFDNRGRRLPLDQDEVAVGRRIYVNSASEYLLHGKRTTRKEIERIFMDTGIGKTAYSIMEQGRMAEILKASPEERRNLFDEAAGISRFKAERNETLNRLNDTEQNLLRLGDILKGKEQELDHLERQARKTRQYLKLKEHLDKFDRNLRYLSYLELEKKKKVIDEKLNALMKKRDELLSATEEREKAVVAKEEENETRSEEMHRLDREFHQDLSRIKSIKENLERIEGERTEKTNRLNNIKERKQGEEKRHKEIKVRLDQSLQLELNMDAEIKTLKDGAGKLDESIKKLIQSLDESVKKEEANTEELTSIDKKQTDLLEELKDVTHELIIELESRKKELEDKESDRITLKKSIVDRLKKGGELLGDSTRKPDDLLNELRGLKLEKLIKDFEKYEAIENEFRSFLFGRTGLLARKEDLDRSMGELQERKEKLIRENNHLFEKRKLDTATLDKDKNRKMEMDLQIRDFEVRRESSAEARENIAAQLKESEERLQFYQTELDAAIAEFERSSREEQAQRGELKEIEKNAKKQTSSIENLKKVIEKTRQEIHQSREQIRKDRESIEKMFPEISEQERAQEQINVQETSLQEDLYNDFQISLGELISECEIKNLRKEHEESEYRRIKGEIVSLGQFNALAIEEEKRAREAYEQLLEQKTDIDKAKHNILKLLNEIDDKSRVLFVDTFQKIQKNFEEVFQALFGGGHVHLEMNDPEDPMTSGIDIMVQPPGKKNASITLLSGGEQNLTAIALMFATYLVRPSPFCLLDEIDAPLDDQNVNRFLKMLTGFADRSQFLMITHNKLSMVASGALFGVTQEEAGVSKIVSVRIKDVESDGKIVQ